MVCRAFGLSLPDLGEKALQGLEARLGERAVLDVVRRQVLVDLVGIHRDQHLAIHREHPVEIGLLRGRPSHGAHS